MAIVWILLAVVGFVVAIIIAVRFEQAISGDPSEELNEPQYHSLPIDPNNPPRTMRYTPRQGRKPLYCTNKGCYHALESGEICLLWPVPQRPGAYDLFCNDCVALRKKSP